MFAQMAVIPLILWCCWLLVIFSGHSAHAESEEANIAYHLLWTSADVSGVDTLLRALYHANNLYLIDVVPPANFETVSSAARRALPKDAALRVRQVDAPVPGGVSEALLRLDGMAEFMWWSATRNFDFYTALTPRCFPRLSAQETRAALVKYRGMSFFRVEGAANSHDVDVLYFDSATVFTRNSTARAALIQPHLTFPDRRYRAARLVRSQKHFVASADLVRVAADSSMSWRMLSVLVHANRVVENFFASLALAAGVPVVQTTSLRCDGHHESTANTCLFADGEGDLDGDVSLDGVIQALEPHVQRATPRRAGELPL